MNWAADRTQRLGQQLSLFRHFAEHEDAYTDFSVHFMYAGSKMDDMVRAINDQLFNPFARDLLKHLRRSSRLETKSVEVPAADRVVAIDHNSAAYSEVVAGLDRIVSELRASNSLKAHEPQNHERALAELQGGRTLLGSMTVRSIAVWTVLSAPLIWLLDKLAGEAIQPLITSIIAALRKLLGF